jgi:hypothetical protein
MGRRACIDQVKLLSLSVDMPLSFAHELFSASSQALHGFNSYSLGIVWGDDRR